MACASLRGTTIRIGTVGEVGQSAIAASHVSCDDTGIVLDSL
jgi:hypothetical protein